MQKTTSLRPWSFAWALDLHVVNGVADFAPFVWSVNAKANSAFRQGALSFGCSHQNVGLSRDMAQPCSPRARLPSAPCCRSGSSFPLHDSQAPRLGDGLLRVSLAFWADDRRKVTPCDLPRTNLCNKFCCNGPSCESTPACHGCKHTRGPTSLPI
jgi:hypothetical protein